jgi:AcrR family transcriptional regulator
MATRNGAPTPAADDDRAAAARAERRSQIVEAAKQVFAEAGYHQASINAIIERAQIARGTFYLYFEGKAAVFDSILEHAMKDLRGRITRIDVEDPTAPPPQDQLKAGLVRVLEYVVHDQALTRILLAGARIGEAQAAQRLAAFYNDVRGIIELALHHGIAMGLVRPMNKKLAAAALLGTVRGVIEAMVVQGVDIPVEDVVNELIALALRGVLA